MTLRLSQAKVIKHYFSWSHGVRFSTAPPLCCLSVFNYYGQHERLLIGQSGSTWEGAYNPVLFPPWSLCTTPDQKGLNVNPDTLVSLKNLSRTN